VDITITAVQCAKRVIAQINPNMPRVQGDGIIHVSSIDYMVPVNVPLPENKPAPPDEVQKEIGRQVASIIENGKLFGSITYIIGATLQMGIGAIPDAVLSQLGNHKRLGIHSEMFSDGIIDLVERGVITNEEKKVHKNQISAGFIMGSKRLYDFVDDNPLVKLYRIQEVNRPAIIAENPKVTAINSAIEIDLTGQVCADSIGGKIFSGFGGQTDCKYIVYQWRLYWRIQ
jgi:acyl-CoA hydrolase